MSMRFVPLDFAEWAEAAPSVHRASARPRLTVPRDTFPARCRRQRAPFALQTLRHWYACEVPLGQEIAQARAFERTRLRRPLLDIPVGLWVPRTATYRLVWPGYVVLVSSDPLTPLHLSRVRLALSGFLGDPPWRLDPQRDLPWPDIALTASWMTPSAPSLRQALDHYRASQV